MTAPTNALRPAKAERLKTLGASDVINYKTTPDSHERVLELTGGARASTMSSKSADRERSGTR